MRRLLKVAERTDSGRLFQREGAHELKALVPVLVLLDPRDGQSDSSVCLLGVFPMV